MASEGYKRKLSVCPHAGAHRRGEVPGPRGMLQRRPEGRLGALAEQQAAGFQTAADRHGGQKHPVL